MQYINVTVYQDSRGYYPSGYAKTIPIDSRVIGMESLPDPTTVDPVIYTDRLRVTHQSFGSIYIGDTAESFAAKINAVTCLDCNTGSGVPDGGTTGQVLAKASNTNKDVTWTTPGGGTSLPSMTSKAGLVLTNDGTTASWMGLGYLVVQGLATGTAAATANTAAINNTIIAAYAIGYGVMVPAGTWYVLTINWNKFTPLRGAGRQQTILKSVNPVPMIQAADLTNIEVYGAGISHFTLYGENVGTKGLDINLIAWCEITDLEIMGFTSHAGHFKGALTFQVNRCVVRGNPYGFVFDEGFIGGTQRVAANLIGLNDCVFGGGGAGASNWAVVHANGAMLAVDKCDFEYNGAPSVVDSGAIKSVNNGKDHAGSGVFITNTWFEANAGTVIRIENSESLCIHKIQNCFWGNAFSYITLLSVSGPYETVIVENCKLTYGLADSTYAPRPEVIVENGARIRGRFSTVSCLKELTGGTYREYPEDSALSGSFSGNGGLSYHAEMMASNPVYYNRTEGSASPIAPQLGTGNLTGTGGMTFGDRYTPFPFDSTTRSICLNDNTVLLETPLPLAGATTFAFAFWAYCNPGHLDQFLSLNWSGNVDGSIIYAVNQPNHDAYVGFHGNAGLNDGIVPAIREAGWYHFAFKGTAGGITQIMRNGVVIYTDAANASNNALIDLTMAWFIGHRFCTLAVWKDANVPTNAAFTRFFQSRYNA